MNKFIQHTIAASMALLAMGATGCSDFLDKQPSNELNEDKTYADWKMFEAFHVDTYNFLLHGANRINGSWLDAATDLAETSFSTGGTLTTFNIGNYYGANGAAELTSVWESRYRGIRKCNRVINDMDRVPFDITMSEDENKAIRATYKAEARTFRAWFYWELFLRYGPLPIVREVLDPEKDDMIGPYKTRPTIKEYVVDFILRELKESEGDLLTYDQAWSSNRIGRLSQPMSRALQCRILMYMASPRYSGDSGISWKEAADASKEFMDLYGANFGLFEEENMSPADNYANALLRTQYTGNNNEVIFFRNDVVINWSGIVQDTPVGEGGNGGNCPSQNLVDMYDMADGSSPFAEYDVTGAPVYHNGVPSVNAASGYDDAAMWTGRDPRLEATVLYQGQPWGTMRVGSTIDVRPGMADNPTGNANSTPTGYYMRKYIPASILASNHAGTAYRLWTIIRYAEIILNYAEALNEVQGPCQEVYDMLDMVRGRAGITGSVADRADLRSQDAMRNFIHKERTVEFAFEEHRPWDVRRWNCAVEALARPIYGVNVAMDGTVTRKVAQTRVFEPHMYLYPIPEAEEWKTEIENNPGW